MGGSKFRLILMLGAAFGWSAAASAQQPGAGGPPGAQAKKKPPAAMRAAKPMAGPQAIACEGAFAKDSSDARVAESFGAENVVFSIVDGPEGTKLNATVVFPKDAKRRLEILWHDQTARVRPSSIVLGGGSAWVGPRGVRVGTPLAEVEKQNGRPFRLAAFGGDYGGSVVDWQGGALGSLAGACQLGLRFDVDPKAPRASRAKVAGDAEFVSTDPNIRAVKPTVSEMFLHYPE
jgi:hypothetical protein